MAPPPVLTALRAKHLLLGHLMQCVSTVPNTARGFGARLNECVVHEQQRLSRCWQIPVSTTSATENASFLRTLGMFAVGRGAIAPDVLDVLRQGFNQSALGFLDDVGTHVGMRNVLQSVGHWKPGDNPFRVIAAHNIQLSDVAHAHATSHTVVHVDDYDPLRQQVDFPVYAIDSATTSEVDDAIGLQHDASGREWITVHVSDATVHCPFGSQLELHSARALKTTTYLPEGVFFMLPKPIVEAATLRSDRPCRSFDVRFRINPDTGAVEDHSVNVGWCNALRRITYDAVEQLLRAKAAVPMGLSPRWLTAQDVSNFHRLFELSVIRNNARRKRGSAFEGSMPDPLIVVEGTDVIDVKDQVLNTINARQLVAEMMIAANEVCALVAKQHGISIPFRGSRPRSSVHEAALSFQAPRGQRSLPLSTDAASLFAQSLVESRQRLFGVTRAMYSAAPAYHSGLDTSDYCHATSPLRRYPDMLVHHQLKCVIAEDEKRCFQSRIEEFQMAELCGNASLTQEKSAIMQLQSERYWILSYLRKLTVLDPSRHFSCLVGETRKIDACADGPRPPNATFVSDVYLPEVQLLHEVLHSDPAVRAGVGLQCCIAAIDPDSDRLILTIVGREANEAMVSLLARAAAVADSNA